MIPQSKTRIGWIGTGVMGSSMCGHILRAGYPVTLHSRTKAKAKPLLDLGATWADNPRMVAAETDILFTMVGFPQDVRSVYFGETGILAGAQSGSVLVDMTTTDPSLSREIARHATVKGLSVRLTLRYPVAMWAHAMPPSRSWWEAIPNRCKS